MLRKVQIMKPSIARSMGAPNARSSKSAPKGSRRSSARRPAGLDTPLDGPAVKAVFEALCGPCPPTPGAVVVAELEGDVLDRDRALRRSSRLDASGAESPVLQGLPLEKPEETPLEHPGLRGRSAGDLPNWKHVDELEAASPAELLLFALAGERGGSSLDRPLGAIADRLAVELEALGALLAPHVDDAAIVDVVHYLAQRARVLAALLEIR